MKSLSVHLTDTCNNSCIFCVVGSHTGTPEKVNKKMVYEFLAANKDKGYEAVNIHGGEPTIVPEFLDILAMIKENGYKAISVQTNGRTLRDIEFAKKAVENGASLFVVSLHGNTPELHDYFTSVPNSFEEAVEGIKNAVKLGIKVRTNTCVCQQNLEQLVDIVNYSMDLGVSHVNISNLHTAGNCLKNFGLVVPRIQDAIPYVEKAVEACVRRNVKVTLEGYTSCVLGDKSRYMIDWEENKFKLLYKSFIMNDYSEFMSTQTRTKSSSCKTCKEFEMCSGVYNEYAAAYGFEEFKEIV